MKKKLALILAVFLSMMMIFTVASRSLDSMSVAQVRMALPVKNKITHCVSGDGKVIQNREIAVSTQANEVVKTLYVEEGQSVEAGEVLFEVDLLTLREQILELQQEMKIDELNAQDNASGRAADAQRKAVSQGRAAEDYQVAANSGNRMVNRAAEELSAAKKRLKALEKSPGDVTAGGDGVNQALQQALADKTMEYDAAVQDKQKLEAEIDAEVQRAKNEAQAEAQRKAEAERKAQEEALRQAEAERQAQEEALRQAEAERQAQEEALRQAEAAQMDILYGGAEAADFTQEAVMYENEDETAQGDIYRAASEEETWDEDEYIFDNSPAGVIENEVLLDAGQTEGKVKTDFTIQSYGSDGQVTAAELDLLERQIRQQNQPLLDAAQTLIEQKEAEVAQARQAMEDYASQQASQAATDRETLLKQYREEVKLKQQAYEDAVASANDGLRTAGRGVEDASLPERTDSTGEIEEITKEQKELRLGKLTALLDAEGKITAPSAGVVTKVNVMTGERTPDGTAVLMADASAGNRLSVQIPAEQEKYIGKGDEVTVKTGRKKETLEGLTVDLVSASEEGSELLEVTVKLPANALEIGTLATMECTKTSEMYDICVPVTALRQEKEQYYVLTIQENESVLGTELTAQRVNVTVLEKNDSMAALEPGALSPQQKVIVSSDKYVDAGDRVRFIEE